MFVIDCFSYFSDNL